MIFVDGTVLTNRIRNANYRTLSSFYSVLPKELKTRMNYDTFLRYIRNDRMPRDIYDWIVEILDYSEYLDSIS